MKSKPYLLLHLLCSIFLSDPLRAQIQATNAPSITLGTSINGQIGGSCLSGACIITGGVTSGKNTFHRFDSFTADTLTGITSVLFDGTQTNGTTFASVLTGLTTLNAPISLSNSGSIVFLSPNGFSVGSSFSLTNVSNLLLTTAQSVKFSDSNIFLFDTTNSQQLSSYDSDFVLDPLTLATKLGDKTNADITISGGISPSESVTIFVQQSLYLDTLGDINITNAYIWSDPFLVGSTDSFGYFSSGGNIVVDASSNLMLNSYAFPNIFYLVDDANPAPSSSKLQIYSYSFVPSQASNANYTSFSNPSFKSVSLSAPSEAVPDPPSDNSITDQVTNTTQSVTSSDVTNPSPVASPESVPLPKTPQETPSDNTSSSDSPANVSSFPQNTSIDTLLQAFEQNPSLTSFESTSNTTNLVPSFLSSTGVPPDSRTFSDSASSTSIDNEPLEPSPNASTEAKLSTQAKTLPSSPPSPVSTFSPIPQQLTVLSSPKLVPPALLNSSFSKNSTQQTTDTVNTLGLPMRTPSQLSITTPSQYQTLLMSVFKSLNPSQ